VTVVPDQGSTVITADPQDLERIKQEIISENITPILTQLPLLATTDFVAQSLAELDLTGLATEDYVTQAISNIDVGDIDLGGLATEDYVDSAIAELNIPTIAGLATENYVNTAISNIQLEDIDLAGLATEGFVNSAVSTAVTNLVNAAPAALDTLKELSAALADDPVFATTVATALGTKAPVNNPTFTGTVSGITATMVGLGNVTNESKTTMFTSPTLGSPTFTGMTTLQQSTKVVNRLTGSSGTVTHNIALGDIWYHTGHVDFTANFTNVPTTDNRTTVITVILNQSSPAYICNNIQINSGGVTINWQDGTVPLGTVNGKDVMTFTLIRVSNNWVALASLQTHSPA